MLRIDISSLDSGVHHVEKTPAPEDLDLETTSFKDIHVSIRLDVYFRRILVELEAKATAILECDRTLQLYDQKIAGEYTLIYASSSIAGEEEGIQSEEIHVLHDDDREIDLTDVVRDTLLLAVPHRAIAPGEEDLEITTKFGIPEDQSDVDPRWEALLKLRSDKSES